MNHIALSAAPPAPALIIDGTGRRCQGPIPGGNRLAAGVDPASLFR